MDKGFYRENDTKKYWEHTQPGQGVVLRIDIFAVAIQMDMTTTKLEMTDFVMHPVCNGVGCGEYCFVMQQ